MKRGTVGDRPWGLTLASFAASRSDGQLTLTADDGKLYCVAFAGGAVVGASSPVVSDSAARVALTSQLVASEQVPGLARAVAGAPGRDEVAVVAEGARLLDEQTAQLRRRLLLQRVARTFAVERGGYVFGERITVATARGIEIDLAPAIFLGVRMNLSQDRLAEDLRRMGSRFVLCGDEVDLERFGFSEAERPILQALRIGTSLPELEAKRRELEPRLTQAVIYTLVVMGLCEGRTAPRTREASMPPPLRVQPPAASPAPVEGEDADEGDELEARTQTDPYVGPRRTAEREQPRTRTISSMPPPGPPLASPPAARDVIAHGIALLEAGADHFALLGVPRDAQLDTIRAAYVALACHLRPEQQREREPSEPSDPATARDAQRLLAQASLALGVLSDPARRAEYLASLRAEPDPARARAGTAGERARAAAEIAQRGLQALRREDLVSAIELLARATELAPQDVDYAAQLAWARFCASTDKAGIAPEVRRALERALGRSQRPVMARFYLGRVERMLGRVREALHHFREVLALEPGHAEAAAELRMLEPRVARR